MKTTLSRQRFLAPIKGSSLLSLSKLVVEAFERTTNPLLKRVQLNHHESRTLAALHDTLLPKLLSEELSVAAAVKRVEARALTRLSHE